MEAQLRVVRTLQNVVTPADFWTQADPQMIIITLMGDSAPRPNKGKGREGEKTHLNVKIGRYAVLLELFAAVQALTDPVESSPRLRAWFETIENRLAAMLEAEVNPDYRRDERFQAE